MNKSAIKNFAIWSRRKLIDEITHKASLIGINENKILDKLPISTDNVQFFDIGTAKPTEISNNEIKQRDELVKKIREKEKTSDYETAFKFVMEEVAYTWFNRLIAIRFMEVNEYLPSRVRVLSSQIEGKAEPDMVTNPFDTDMEFSSYEQDRIRQLKDENRLDELFRMLFIKQCNKLNEVLPELFEKTADYTEFLLNISFTDKDGIINHLVNDIPEKDFTEAVEIIGWLYQYYNTEPKDEVFALLKKNVKITKERIPAATQLFTPDWIVRYMVENSLGRLWVEGHPNESLKNDWKYYLEEAEQEEEVKKELEKIREEYKKLNPEDIKIIDPCMGSGHILVYAFDVLMQIYESEGYTQRDAAQAIIENNIYGLDIDDRAYQLAYFAIMMKAKKYDRRFLSRGIAPKVYSIQESNNINKSQLQYYGKSLSDIERNTAVQQMEYLLDLYHDAKEYGSILNVESCNWELLNKFVNDYNVEGQMSLESFGAEQSQTKMRDILSIAEAMEHKYEVVITNPPYMGGSGMNKSVSEYVKKNYPDSKSDLFAVFIEKCTEMTKKTCYQAMITQHSFMFLSSYENLREKLLTNDFVNMAHLGARAFEEIGGEVVQTTSFVIRKSNIIKCKANFVRLVEENSQKEKEKSYLNNRLIYRIQKDSFSKIPSSSIAYWVSEKVIKTFFNQTLGSKSKPCKGIDTGDNNRFLKLWFEVEKNKFCLPRKERFNPSDLSYKWYPYNKGGSFKKWYGNNEYVLNWGNDGNELKDFKGSNLRNKNYYFRDGITWSTVTSGGLSLRYFEYGYLFDNGGCCLFAENNLLYILSLLNSKIQKITMSLSPTINFQPGDVGRIPFIIPESKTIDSIESIANRNISISKTDWDMFETSWDFKTHPLLCEEVFDSQFSESKGTQEYEDIHKNIINHYNAWAWFTDDNFKDLKENEEELNRIFIEIYGLQDELNPEVEDKDITIHRIFDTKEDILESMKKSKYVLTKKDVINSFISYSVGCMLGRYSLDIDGLAYAGGEWDTEKYTTFIPDADNVIPITDEEYFEDDIVGRFVEFVKKVYGEETLEENIDFIADALGNKGDTSREIIRNYFLKDFFKDHVKTYQKRPIYWLYDSGKQNGFKALVYMHCYNADTTGIVRVDYLHKMQKIYTNEIERMQDTIDNSKVSREVAQAEKRKEKLIKQLKETKEYDEKIAHIALSRIDIDLDDGVKVNYEKVQTGKDGKRLNILAKI